MDLTYAPEDREFRAATRRWLEANVPGDDLKTLAERKAWHRKLYEAGYVGMLWPREYGGWGATPMRQAIVQDEMARVSAPPQKRQESVASGTLIVLLHTVVRTRPMEPASPDDPVSVPRGSG